MPRRSRQKPKRARKSNPQLSGSALSAGHDDDANASSQRPDKPTGVTSPVQKPVQKDDQPGWFTPSIAAVTLVGLVIRCWHVLQTASLPTVEQALGDSKGYLSWAARLAEGDWYGSETFYQAPLYPLLPWRIDHLGRVEHYVAANVPGDLGCPQRCLYR